MEDDGLGILELTQEGREPFVELVGRNPARALDMAADVILVGETASAKELHAAQQ